MAWPSPAAGASHLGLGESLDPFRSYAGIAVCSVPARPLPFK